MLGSNCPRSSKQCRVYCIGRLGCWRNVRQCLPVSSVVVGSYIENESVPFGLVSRFGIGIVSKSKEI